MEKLSDLRRSSRSRRAPSKSIDYCIKYDSDVSEKSVKSVKTRKKSINRLKKNIVSKSVSEKETCLITTQTDNGKKFFPIFASSNSIKVKNDVLEQKAGSSANTIDNNIDAKIRKKISTVRNSLSRKFKKCPENSLMSFIEPKSQNTTFEIIKDSSQSAKSNKLFPIFSSKNIPKCGDIDPSDSVKPKKRKVHKRKKLNDDEESVIGIECLTQCENKIEIISNVKMKINESLQGISNSTAKRRGRKKHFSTDSENKTLKKVASNVKECNVISLTESKHKRKRMSNPINSAASNIEFKRVTRSQHNKVQPVEKLNSISDKSNDIEVLTECISTKKQSLVSSSKKLIQNHANHLKNKAKHRLTLKDQKFNSTKLYPLFGSCASAIAKNKSSPALKEKSLGGDKNKVRSSSKNKQMKESRSIKTLKVLSNNSKIPHKLSESELIEENTSTSSIEELIVEIKDIPCVENLKQICDNIKSINEPHNKVSFKSQSQTNYPPSKYVNTSLTYPLYSHCNPEECSSEPVVVETNLLEEFTFEINYPVWDKIIGLTDIKSIDQYQTSITNRNSSSQNEFILNKNVENCDLLWTDITNSNLFWKSTNKSCVEELRQWLLHWKSKLNKNTSKQKIDNDDSMDYSSDSCESDSEIISNSVILTGAPGTGKTSLVFSLANELGFKVLEVNASGNRSGRNITHQLKEALESYHVENIKIDGSLGDIKNNSSKIEFDDDSLKKAACNNGKSTTNYFSGSEKPEKKQNVKKSNNINNFFKPKEADTSRSKIKKKRLNNIDVKTPADNNVLATQKPLSDSSYKISSHTIILFDDIDVVFEEDESLWSTIRSFLKISKKPFIFTVGRNLPIVTSHLNCEIKILHLLPMSNDEIVDSLKDQCLKNYREVASMDLKLLASWNAMDVRRSLLYTQFWAAPSFKNDLPNNCKDFMSYDFRQIDNFISCKFSSHSLRDFICNSNLLSGCNVISSHLSQGYDLIHNNLFSFLNITNEQNIKQEWHSVTKQPETLIIDNSTLESNMWQEACAAFEFKKKILKAGSPSKDLFTFSSLLDSFSYGDMLKGYFRKDLEWLSLAQRIENWTSGLPACSEIESFPVKSLILELISLMQILKLREINESALNSLSSPKTDVQELLLEHPFLNMSNSIKNKISKLLDNLALILPTCQHLNKTALNMDYLSTLKNIHSWELLRKIQSGKRSNRFLHYFDSISLYIDKSQIDCFSI